MATIYNTNEKVKLKNIEEFEAKYHVVLPVQYRDFLLEYNGGNVKPNVFKISDDEGETALNALYGLEINESYDELSSVFDSLYGEIPNEFISIGDDSGGNQICLGTSEEYTGKIYI
ncbi:SMI1/KNR4 family protein, partial [Legionella pneumophila]